MNQICSDHQQMATSKLLQSILFSFVQEISVILLTEHIRLKRKRTTAEKMKCLLTFYW